MKGELAMIGCDRLPYKTAGESEDSASSQPFPNLDRDGLSRQNVDEAISILEAAASSPECQALIHEVRKSFIFDLALLNADGPSDNLEFAEQVLKQGGRDE